MIMPLLAFVFVLGISGSMAAENEEHKPQPEGADFRVSKLVLKLSTQVKWVTFEPNDCAIQEGIISKPGRRKLLVFTSLIANKGNQDFELGNPADPKNADIFKFSACHGHYHLAG